MPITEEMEQNPINPYGRSKLMIESILEDFTNPEDYEDKSEKMKNYDETADLKEVTTDESQFREWDGIDDDWEEFNSREENNKKRK